MKKHLSPLVLLLLLLAGCTPAAEVAPTPTPVPSPTEAVISPIAPPPEPLDFRAFLRQINDGRRALLSTDAPLPDIGPYTPDYADQLGTFTAQELDALFTPHEVEAGGLTPETGAEDVETLFRILKTTYGAYPYFGGDQVFLPIKDAVLADLAQERYIFSSTLEKLLLRHLSPVLVDGHFSINFQSANAEREQTMYYVPDHYFTDPAGLDMDYVRPTIAPDGSIQYCFATLSHDGTDLPGELDGQALSWRQAGLFKRTDETVFAEREAEGIPVLESRQMAVNDTRYAGEQTAQLERLSTCGGEYAESPLFVFDVRANGGGSSIYGMEWFRGFSGHYPQRRSVSAKKHGDLFREVNRRWSLETGNPPTEYPPDGQWSVYENPGTWVEYEGVIFVLMDGNTASAGEEIVQNMSTVDNVVFVGCNTSGCYTVVSNYDFYLPHSGLSIRLGQGLSLGTDGVNRDGVGFLPDLWVNPPDALDAVVRLTEYYGLK